MNKSTRTHERETWRPIPGTGGRFSASTFGRIRRNVTLHRRPAGTIVAGHVNEDGYLRMRPYPRPDRRIIAFHRLIAETFLGPCPDGHEVNHIDGNRRNNAPANLEYVTHLENIAHAWREPREVSRGETHCTAKLTEADVREIRRRCAAGEYQYVVAADYGVTQSAVGRAVLRKTWAHVE